MGVEGYFTVEAALVLPMVLAEVVLIIYLLFFQYDRCLMEQDLGVLMFRGITMAGEDNRHKMEELEKYVAKQDTEKYLVWDREDIKMKIERGILCVSQKGQMSTTGVRWDASRTYEGHFVSPVFLIRSVRRMTGGK